MLLDLGFWATIIIFSAGLAVPFVLAYLFFRKTPVSSVKGQPAIESTKFREAVSRKNIGVAGVMVMLCFILFTQESLTADVKVGIFIAVISAPLFLFKIQPTTPLWLRLVMIVFPVGLVSIFGFSIVCEAYNLTFSGCPDLRALLGNSR